MLLITVCLGNFLDATVVVGYEYVCDVGGRYDGKEEEW